MNKKAQKAIMGIIVGILLIGLVGGGLYYFLKVSSKGGVTDVTASSDDGFATLTATFFDFSGDAITPGVTQALIGGINKKTHVAFQLAVSNTGNADLTDVRVTSPNANMNGAFDNIGNLANLNIGVSGVSMGSTSQSCTLNSGCDTNEECCDPLITDGTACNDGVGSNKICAIALNPFAVGTTQNNVDFSISIKGDFLTAQGTTSSVTSNPVILTYDVRSETCSDGTTINSCVFGRTGIEADKPDYCEFIEGSAPTIVEKASICQCPAGQDISGDTCIDSTCADGTIVNTCSVLTNEDNYGAYMFCLPSETFEPRCVDCGATLDANGNAKISCSPATSGVLSHAVYETYSGGLSGTLTE